MKNPNIKKIIIGADHLGKDLKKCLKEHIEKQGYEIEDIGVSSSDRVDYPDIGSTLAKKVSDKELISMTSLNKKNLVKELKVFT